VFASDFFAGAGAGLTNISASRASGKVQGRIAGHEIGGGLADLDTISHKANMLGRDMFSAFFYTMGEKRFLAFRPAFPAQLSRPVAKVRGFPVNL